MRVSVNVRVYTAATGGAGDATQTIVRRENARRAFLHAFVIWLACGLTIALGRGAFGMETTLIIHAIAAPAFAAIVSFVYFEFPSDDASPTAAFFILFIVLMDALLVAPFFEKSYAMFSSPLGNVAAARCRFSLRLTW